jgi:serine/threonine protein kinase/formylglycine-generating enzyme required for sulfatase activity
MADERDRVGELFHGKYRILSEVGVGGFGTVFEARDERGAGNKVAIKVLRKHAARSPELMRRFKREARHLTRLHHPNIVDWKVFDEDEEGTPYFVMELVEGDELHKVLKEHAPLPWQRVAELTLGVLDALHAAHDAGLLHLDLKPRNVFVVPGRRGGETVRVIDFGIAQYVGGEGDEVIDPRGVDPVALLTKEQQGEADPDASMVTLSVGGVTTMVTDAKGNQFERSIACTANYVSPEQGAHVLGHDDIVPLDGRADLFSVGLMAYEMLTGKLPYDAVMMGRDILPQHVTRAPHLASDAGVKAPRAFLRFLDKLLAFDREGRWPNSKVAHDELQKILRPAVVGWLAPMLGVVVASLAFAGWQALQDDSGPQVATAMLMRDMQPLSQTGLALGPGNPSAEMALASIELDRWAQAEWPLLLVDQRTGEAAAGWAVQFAPPDAITISAGHGDGQAPHFSHATVSLDGGPELLPPFELSWLGADMWTADVWVGGVVLSPGQGAIRQVDPADLGLEVVVEPEPWAATLADPGDAFSYVASLSIRAERVREANEEFGDAGEPWTDGWGVSLLPKGPPDGGARSWELPTPDALEVDEGAYRLTILLTDIAGAERRLTEGLLVEAVSSRLTLQEADLRRRGSDGELMAVRSVGSGLAIVTPSSDLVVVARTSRPAALAWRLLGPSDEEFRAGDGPIAEIHEIPLDPDWFGDRAFLGSVELKATDQPMVLRGGESGRGTDTAFVPFRYVPRPVALRPIASLEATFEPLPPEVGAGGASVERGRFTTADARAALRLEISDAGAADRLPLDVIVRWIADGDGKEIARETFTSLRSQISTFVEVPVLPDDVVLPGGRYSWLIDAVAVDLETTDASDVPEWRARYDLRLDDQAPELIVEGLAGDVVLRAEDPWPGSLDLTVVEDSPLRSCTWQLVPMARDPAGPIHDIPVTTGARPGTWTAQLDSVLPEDLPDGPYALIVGCEDLAGNRAAWRSQIHVSRSGPIVELVFPHRSWSEGSDTWEGAASPWRPDPDMEAWRLTFRIINHGHELGMTTVAVRGRQPGSSPPVPIPSGWDQAEVPEGTAERLRPHIVQSLSSEDLLVWRDAPDDYSLYYGWSFRSSEAEVEIIVEAEDEFGSSRGPRAFGPFRLPPIEAPRHEALAVAFGDHDVQPMRLVPGNADRVYVFGGRNDARENVTFVEAGWPLFNPRATGGSPRGWEIEYQRDEIGDFYLDEREVTVGQFLEFLSAEGGFLTGAHWASGNAPGAGRRQELLDGLAAREPGAPVTGASWDEAHAYANWVGKRLPSLVEWEFAVRGSEYRPSSLLVAGSEVPSGSIPSPGEDLAPGTRVADLCSSVAEWTGTPESFDASASSLASPRENLADHRLETLSPGLHPGAHSRPSYWVAGRASAGSAYTFDAVMPVDRDATLIDVGFRCAVSRSEYLERLGDLSEPRLVESRP